MPEQANLAPVMTAGEVNELLARIFPQLNGQHRSYEAVDVFPGGCAHACELETSMYLYLDEENVRKDKIKDDLASYVRDGNPYVTAQMLRYAVRAQSAVAFAHCLEEVHRLGAELSLSTRLVKPSAALLALADAAGDSSEHRRDEPYRQALIGIYARLAANPIRCSLANSGEISVTSGRCVPPRNGSLRIQ